MAPTATAPTGYVGNLTPFQEEKLQEFWLLIFTSAASVLSAVYDVPIPEDSPGRLFEAIVNIQEPSVDAIIAALNVNGENGTPASSNDSNTRSTTSTTTSMTPGSDPTVLDKIDALANNRETKKRILSELSTRKVTPEHFSTLFNQLRKQGVSNTEIKSTERILSKLSPEEMASAVLRMVKHEHPDSLLLRFLRARKWDVSRAFAMMASAILWRKEREVDDDILPRGEMFAVKQARDEGLSAAERKEGRDFLAQMEMGKSYLHGLDREGRPVNIVRVRLHKPGAQSQRALERYIVHVIETNRMMVVPPVETGTIVFDMTGFSLSNMEYSPVKFILQCFEANYPESLGLLLIHNAPWIFSGIWKIIHGWMDPVVASKVRFTRSISDLDEFIPRSRLPKDLGGDEDWEYTYVPPKEGENDAMQDTQTRDALMVQRMMVGVRLLGVTAAWISASKKVQASVGDEEGRRGLEEIKKQRAAVVEEFRANYWKLDRYVRARALIDRIGVLEPNGKVNA